MPISLIVSFVQVEYVALNFCPSWVSGNIQAKSSVSIGKNYGFGCGLVFQTVTSCRDAPLVNPLKTLSKLLFTQSQILKKSTLNCQTMLSYDYICLTYIFLH